MENNKRRLLKDLPFERCTKGTVLYKGGRGTGGKYTISSKETYYEGGTRSGNGLWGFDKQSEEILDLIWDNPDWFADADLKHIDFVYTTDSVTLRFAPIDAEDAHDLMRGLIHVLPQLAEGKWVWNKFKDITTGVKNN